MQKQKHGKMTEKMEFIK